MVRETSGSLDRLLEVSSLLRREITDANTPSAGNHLSQLHTRATFLTKLRIAFGCGRRGQAGPNIGEGEGTTTRGSEFDDPAASRQFWRTSFKPVRDGAFGHAEVLGYPRNPVVPKKKREFIGV